MGYVAQGAQSEGGAVQQHHFPAQPQEIIGPGGNLLGRATEGFGKHLQWQALAGVTQRGGGQGAQLFGKALVAGAQAVSAAIAGIGQGLAEGMVGSQALEDAIPEGDEGCESPLVERLGCAGQPGGQQSGWQQGTELGQELWGREAGAQAGWGWRVWGGGFSLAILFAIGS